MKGTLYITLRIYYVNSNISLTIINRIYLQCDSSRLPVCTLPIHYLLHISEVEHRRLDSLEGVLKEGDKVRVKLMDVDPRSGKMKLSRKVLLPKEEKVKA